MGGRLCLRVHTAPPGLQDRESKFGECEKPSRPFREQREQRLASGTPPFLTGPWEFFLGPNSAPPPKAHFLKFLRLFGNKISAKTHQKTSFLPRCVEPEDIFFPLEVPGPLRLGRGLACGS